MARHFKSKVKACSDTKIYIYIIYRYTKFGRGMLWPLENFLQGVPKACAATSSRQESGPVPRSTRSSLGHWDHHWDSLQESHGVTTGVTGVCRVTGVGIATSHCCSRACLAAWSLPSPRKKAAAEIKFREVAEAYDKVCEHLRQK